MSTDRPLFLPGRTLATPGALAILEEADIAPASLLDRHCAGDSGDVPPEDAAENDFSLGRNWGFFACPPEKVYFKFFTRGMQAEKG